MKNKLFSALMLVAFLGFAGSVQAPAKSAAQSFDIVIGKVISIDNTNGTFVDKVIRTQEEKTFSADAKIIAKLNVDEDVKLYVTPGTDKVVKVKELQKHVAPRPAR
jgi:phosphoribulokinase